MERIHLHWTSGLYSRTLDWKSVEYIYLNLAGGLWNISTLQWAKGLWDIFTYTGLKVCGIYLLKFDWRSVEHIHFQWARGLWQIFTYNGLDVHETYPLTLG